MSVKDDPPLAHRALSAEEVEGALASLDGWSVAEGKLQRVFRFGDFSEAWGFMSRVALIAETLDHHPEWSNVWATVQIELITHDVGALSPYDVAFARRVDALVPGTA